MNFDLNQHTILLTVGGSRAYGINTATSDVDVKGVCIPPAIHYHGFAHHFEQADESSHIQKFASLLTDEEKAAVVTTKVEGVVYEIRKFISLAVDCNPNILDVLFCRDSEVRLALPLGERLRDHRRDFLSTKCKHTFSGYAAAQLKRIRGHRAWLINPPKDKPTRVEYGLPEHTLIPKDHLAAVQASIRKQMDSWELDLSGVPQSTIVHVEGQVSSHLAQMAAGLGVTSEDAKWLAAARTIGLNDNLIEAMQHEREYEAASRHWTQHQEWRKNRNPDRAALEEKYGYDCKHGAHLYRLLKMCREILTTGQVNVWRGDLDAEEILSIRRGTWPYDKLVEWAETEDKALTELYRTPKDLPLPKQPDRDAINKLCAGLVEDGIR